MALSDFERSTMTARPSDMGAGGAGLGASFENLLKTLTGMQSTKGLLGDGKNPLDKKMVVWGSERQQGPIARALSEAFSTLKQGGNNLMEGVAAPLSNGTENGYGYHEGQGIRFSEVDSSSAIAPAATPDYAGLGGLEASFSPT